MIAIGMVAKCSKGQTGLILGIRKVPRCLHNRCREKPLYTGVCLDRGRIGQKWQSINPEFIGTLDDWIHHRYKELTEESDVVVSNT